MAMNFLERKRQEEQVQPASGLRGVSENTRKQLAKYESGYQPSQQTQQAQQDLAAVKQQKPQTYKSKYGPELDGILAQIQNQPDFKYSFDGDEMFKYYADLMTQNAKQGAANAMGQAVGLTGGYGNSWASGQANQAYQQAILPLYDRGMDLRDRAYQQYQDKQGNLMDQAGLLSGMDATDYGRYRDTVSDYYADVDRAQAEADNAQAFDYNNYKDMLGHWTDAANAENADMRADQDEAYRQQTFQQSVEEFNRTNELDWAQLEEQQREYDAGLSEDQRQYNQKVAIAYVTDILANGQMPSTELLVAAGLSYEDAQKLMAQIQTGGGPGKQDDDEEEPAETKDPSVLPQLLRDRYKTLYTANEYAPKTSNLDTPVSIEKQLNTLPGTAAKTTTGVIDPISYNAMIQRMFDEDLKKTKK